MQYTKTLVQNKNNKFMGIVRWTHEGKEKRKTKTFSYATTKRQAEIEFDSWLASLNISHEMASKSTLYEFTCEYIEKRADSQIIEPITAEAYRYVARYMDKYLNYPLDELNPAICQNWIAELLNAGYSIPTVRKTYTLARSVCDDAVYLGYIEQNPFKRVKPPKLPQKQPNALDTKQRARLKENLEMAGLSDVNIGVMLALYCGMRQAEICALRWRDVDLDTRMITIVHSLGQIKGKYKLKATKTDRIRTAPIPESLYKKLVMWRQEQQFDCVQLGKRFTDDLFVIGKIDGTYMRPDYLGKTWSLTARALNYKGVTGSYVTFHDLRHTFASAAIAGGVDVKTVSSILGHANAAMTLNVYACADPDAKRQAADTLDRII